MKLDIGCGGFKRDGFIGVDIHPSADIQADLEKGLSDLDLDDCTVDEIWADNVLEHITNLIKLMNDIYYVLKPKGILNIRVPLANTTGSLKDPTHVRQFVPESFDYFDLAWDYERQPDYGIKKWNILPIVLEKEDDNYQYLRVTMVKPE